MKHIFNKWTGFAICASLLVSCTEEYDCNLVVEKPAEVVASEHLNRRIGFVPIGSKHLAR